MFQFLMHMNLLQIKHTHTYYISAKKIQALFFYFFKVIKSNLKKKWWYLLYFNPHSLKNPRENAECKFAVGPIFPSDYFSGFDASLCKMVDGSRGINKKGAGGHSSVVWVASCCKKAPFRKHRRRYHKRCLFRIMEVINCSFIHIYKQSNRVIPSLGREIGNVGTYIHATAESYMLSE